MAGRPRASRCLRAGGSALTLRHEHDDPSRRQRPATRSAGAPRARGMLQQRLHPMRIRPLRRGHGSLPRGAKGLARPPRSAGQPANFMWMIGNGRPASSWADLPTSSNP
ncbi:hypothetical protein G6F65_021194 [Rhizopus arrhizus]|nr:hypothetical protein G6F65_021194 [Rhizopus arrhizus]KAG1386418.1 hypothetical protein G6F59_016869 [Rhizopus arrhizus]